MTTAVHRIGRIAAPEWLWIAVWLAALAWTRPLLPPDETRYVGIAWEMLRSGNWLVPTLDGLPFLHKPPLFYWITAGGLALFGHHEWAARLAPLTGAMACIWSLHFLVQRWSGLQTARNSMLVLATMPFFYVGAQFANMDMLVAGCISACIALGAHATLSMEARQPYRGALVAAYAAAGLGVLTKGLIGAVLPALVILMWLALRGQIRTVKTLFSAPGLILFAALVAPWFLLMQMQFPDFLHYFVVVHHLQRFAQGGFNNVQPFWFYPVVIGVLILPWSLWLYRTAHRSYLRTITASPLRLLMWTWLTVVVLFFSLPQSKLVGYALPVLAPLAFLIVDATDSTRHSSARAHGWWNTSIIVAMAIGVTAVVSLTFYHPASMRDIARTLSAQRATGEPVVALDAYYYELPYYAGLEQPVAVADHWDDPAIPQHDNWRKELFEAGQFAPEAAARTLIAPGKLPELICQHTRAWILAPLHTGQRYPLLTQAHVIATSARAGLWRIDARDIQCPTSPANAQ